MLPQDIQQQPIQQPVPSRHYQFLWLIIACLIVISAVLVIILATKKNTPTISSISKPVSTIASPAQIDVTSAGFVPATINVARGTTVTWTNTDSSPHWIASDPYPTDTDLAGLNSKLALQTGDSYSFTFNNAGTFTYHDQLNPYTDKGVVVVN